MVLMKTPDPSRFLEWIRSERFRITLARHVIPIVLFILLSVIVHRNALVADGVFLKGDLARPLDLESYSSIYYPLWNEDLSVPNLSQLPQLMLKTQRNPNAGEL